MPLLAPLRRALAALLPALLVLALLPPGAALATPEKLYEGKLLPADQSGGIPVTIDLRRVDGMLLGRVKAGPPLSAIATVTAGDMVGDKCDFQASFDSGTTLRFVGICQGGSFEGRFSTTGRRDAGSHGSFRLARKEPDKTDDPDAGRTGAAPPLPSLTECISANTRCLGACPQGDYNTEFLCANRCRSKYKACKKAAQP